MTVTSTNTLRSGRERALKVFPVIFCLFSAAQVQPVQCGVLESEAGHRASAADCSASGIAKLHNDASGKADEPAWSSRLSLATDADTEATPTRYGYRVINRYPHDQGAFTQGLVFLGDTLYESTGLFGESTLREVDLQSGEVLRLTRLDKRFFGEGLTVLNRRLVQLTWKAGVALVYETESLIQSDRFDYPGEGWGSTSVGSRLLVSNGSSVLTWLEPGQEGIAGAIHVREGDRPVHGLNELEYVEGKILANVWPSDCVAEIDPYNGRVTGWIDFNGLFPIKSRPRRTAVLNGIAYIGDQKRLFVTGKLWPYLYAIERVAVKPEEHAATGK